jgi:4-amino-4-deoxy-L-arabinose transferase-like glycosyltransferase
VSKRYPARNRHAPAGHAAVGRLSGGAQPILTAKIVAVGVAIAAWIALYLAVPLPALGPRTAAGDPWRRWDLLLHYLLLPDELVVQWLGVPPEYTILDRLPVIAGAAAILGIAGLAGWLLMRLLGACAGLTRLEVLVFSLGAGLNVVSLYTLAVGLAGQLQQPAAFAAPAVAVIAIAAMVVWFQSRSGRSESDLPKASTGGMSLSTRWLWLAAPIVAVVLLGGMLPPADFDVREYHLQAPKEFYQLGRIEFLPHNVYANMPLGAELLSLPAMAILGDWWFGALSGKTLIAAFLPLTALTLYAAGRRLVSTSAGIVASLVYLSVPGLGIISVSGLIEGALAFYLLLALYAVVLPSAALPRLLLAGFLAGAAVACKYPALVFVVLPLAAFVASSAWRKHSAGNPQADPLSIQETVRLKETAVVIPGPAPTEAANPAKKERAKDRWGNLSRLSLSHSAIFLIAASIACGPWLLKNAVLTGNPVYPLMFSVFDGETRTPEKNAQWQRAHSPPNYRLQDLLNRLADLLLRGDLVSPILVPLAALAVIRRRRHPLVIALAAYLAFLFGAWWLLTHRIERFFVPALPIAALLAGIGAERLVTLGWRKSLVGLLIFALAANLILISSPEGYAAAPGSPAAFVRYFASLDRLRNSPERIDPWHIYLNQQAPRDSVVLLVGDAAVFDLRMPIHYNSVFDSCVFEQLATGRSSEQVHDALAQHGITYVYVDWGDIRRYRSLGNYDFTPFVQPELFQKLVADRVLEGPLPTTELTRTGILDPPENGRIEHPGELYRVRGQGSGVRGQRPESGIRDHPVLRRTARFRVSSG